MPILASLLSHETNQVSIIKALSSHEHKTEVKNALIKNDAAAIEYLKHISPVASQHINISGLYEFIETIKNINIDNVV